MGKRGAAVSQMPANLDIVILIGYKGNTFKLGRRISYKYYIFYSRYIVQKIEMVSSKTGNLE